MKGATVKSGEVIFENVWIEPQPRFVHLPYRCLDILFNGTAEIVSGNYEIITGTTKLEKAALQRLVTEGGAYDLAGMMLSSGRTFEAFLDLLSEENFTVRLAAMVTMEELAAAEERNRLARELHDSVSQVLYGVGLGARTARVLLDRAGLAPELKSSLAEPLDYVLSQAEAGLAEMRALIFELRPDSLEREGLVAALTRQAAALRARHGLEVHTEFCTEPTLSFEEKEAFYRISQESLNNTVKHAQAERVDIRLCASQGEIALELTDDGVGFDPQAEYSGHMGLNSMRERAAQTGGVLEIVSEAGRGAVVRVRIPAPHQPATNTSTLAPDGLR